MKITNEDRGDYKLFDKNIYNGVFSSDAADRIF